MFEKNVPFLDTDYARGIWRRKKIYVYAKRVIGDLLVMNPAFRETLQTGIFGKMNPVDLLIVGESFRIFAVSFAEEIFFHSYYDYIKQWRVCDV